MGGSVLHVLCRGSVAKCFRGIPLGDPSPLSLHFPHCENSPQLRNCAAAMRILDRGRGDA